MLYHLSVGCMNFWNKAKMIQCDHMLTLLINISSRHSLPLNALALWLNLWSILQHMASLQWLSSHSYQPISTSLEVRTYHLSKSWILLFNYTLCEIAGQTHKHDFHKMLDICTWGWQLGLRQARRINMKENNGALNSSMFTGLHLSKKKSNVESSHCFV